MIWIITLIVVIACLLGLGIYDLFQRKDSILRNFPIVGHGRNVLISLGPKLRQYIVASNDEERPFTRDQRDWIYRSARDGNNYFGFGTDNNVDNTPNYLIIKHSTFPLEASYPDDPDFDPQHAIPAGKILGGFRKRAKAFRPESIVNTSAMSFGSLSSVAVEAISRGCKISGCLQNTGEGGVAPHHDHGSGLIWQLGTGYFGARTDDGNFCPDRFQEAVEKYDVRAVEVKLSQGAKPGKGGVLPAAKITPEIASIRGIPRDRDCVSPAYHKAFSNVDGLLDFVETLSERSGGLPVGIKSAVGQMDFWYELVDRMEKTGRAVDYVQIDGGEGGTGAAPLVFSDHVAMPFTPAFSRVHRVFYEAGWHERVLFIGSGKLGFPQSALFAFSLGCDMIAVGREAMMSVGCIQAQQCHTDHCPSGVATQNKWLMRGLHPEVQARHFAHYIVDLRKEIADLSNACGVEHPALITTDHFEILNPGDQSLAIKEFLQLPGESRMPSVADRQAIVDLMRRDSMNS